MFCVVYSSIDVVLMMRVLYIVHFDVYVQENGVWFRIGLSSLYIYVFVYVHQGKR
jgi:hypothetical protein